MKHLLFLILLCASTFAQQKIDINTGTKGNLLVPRITPGVAGQCLTTDGGGNTAWGVCAAGGGSGTVTSFSAGNLSPLFTTSVATQTTTPALSFSLSNAAAHTFFGNTSGSTGPPAFASITTADLPGKFSQTLANVSHKWLNSYDASTGLFTQTQPDYTDLTGLPTLPANTPAVASNFFTAYNSSTGAFTKATIGNGDLPGSGALTVNTAGPLGGGGSVSLGGTLSLTCTGCLTSVTGHNLLSATHSDTTAHSVVRGDLIAGIGISPSWTAVAKGGTNTYPKWNSSGDVVPSTLAASGIGACSANQYANTLNADAAPTCSQVSYAQVSGTPAVPTGTGFSHVTSGALDAAAKLVNLTAATDVAANQGTTTTVLHGNAAGQASFSAVTSADTTGTFPPNPNALLDGSAHSDTAAGTVARGDVITGQSASAKWTRLAKGTASQCLQMDGSAVDIVWGSCGAGGSGASTADTFITVAHDADLTAERILACTAGDLTCTDGGANNSFTLDTGANIPKITTSNTYSASTTQDFDTARAKYWGGAPIFDAFEYAGADMCAKIIAVEADAAYTGSGHAIIDARGFTGLQNCASNPFVTNVCTQFLFGEAFISVTAQLFLNGNPCLTIPAPSAPSLSTSTSGGSLAAATTYGVKINYVNIASNTAGDGSLPSTEATKLTGAGATNSITVTSPAASLGAVCYNVYSTATAGSGWKLNNTTGCIPLGTNYIIQTVGAGVVPPASSNAFEGSFEVKGMGDATIFSLDNTSAGFALVNDSNIVVRDIKITSSQTSTTNSGAMWVGNANHILLENLTISGHGHQILVNAASSDVRIRNVRLGVPTIAATGSLFVQSATNVQAEDIYILTPAIWPTFAGFMSAATFTACNDCSLDGFWIKNQDFSTITNAAAVSVQNSSLRTHLNNIHCNLLVNADCIAVLTLSLDTAISNATVSNTTVGSGAGAGTNTNNGDAIDLFGAGRVTITNVTAQSLGLVGGLRFPCFEFFDSAEISATNINCFDSSGEGVRIFGSPGTTISASHFNRNGKSGVSVEDSATVVTCNNTTTVAYVSGNGFGPWPPGTIVNIGAGPTAFQIASVTSVNSLVLTAACNLGASQAFSVYSQDTHLTGIQTDDNGQGVTGANAQSGISVTGHSQATIEGGSMNDNRATASKTQQFGISATTAGGQTSRVRVIGSDFSGNLGTTCSGIEYGANVAGNHGMCDGNKLSAVLFDDNVGGKWTIAASQTTDASLNIPSGTAPTSPVAGDVWFDGTDFKVRQSSTTFSVEKVVASGTATFTTTAVAAAACQTTVTVSATNTSTNDIIVWSFQTAPVTGTDASLIVNFWPTTNNVNFKRCNPTAGSITPTALVANWQVLRR